MRQDLEQTLDYLEAEDDEIEDLHALNKQWKPFRDGLVDPDARSLRSTTSTIPPEEVKRKVKNALAKKDRTEKAKRIRAKGDASAIVRPRRDNTHEIKASKDAFWADD